MPAPFYNDIKGTTSGTPGTGAFTPNAAATGFRAWSNVPVWMGLVRYEDGSAWELTWSYWNGTTLSRASTQVFDSSSGSQLTLTSAATAAFAIDASNVQPLLGTTRVVGWVGNYTGASLAVVAGLAIAATGTLSGKTLAGTNLFTALPAVINTSATTPANSQAGFFNAPVCAVVSTTAGIGGFEYVTRFGIAQLPTGPRLFAGMTDVSFLANAGEPSALTANVAVFAKDSTDTNIQLLVNSNAGSGTKTDTGIALAVNGVYDMKIWCEPGSNTVNALLFQRDTGAIWFGSTTTDVPATGALMIPQIDVGLSGTTGTAAILHFSSMFVRAGP